MVRYSGWVHREEAGIVKSFKKRWCVVEDTAVCIYKADNDMTQALDIFYAEDIVGVSAAPTEKSTDRAFGFELIMSYGSTVLRCALEEDQKEWMAALKLLTYREKPNTTNTVDYVTIECFVQKGIRVDGLIEPQILAILSDVEGKATDTTKRAKKIQDVKGWYCDRFVTVPDVINLMGEYDWQLCSCSGATSQPSTEKSLMTCHQLIFKRSTPN